MVGDELAHAQRLAGTELGLHDDLGAVADALVSTVTGEGASISWSIPHASSSPLLRVAR